MNKKGLTLVELLVYIVIAGFLLAPVIMMVQRSSLFMAKDSESAALRTKGEDVMQIFYDDIKNTGFKTELQMIHNAPNFTINNDVVIDPVNDQSSFSYSSGLDHASNFDELTIRSGIIDDQNDWVGVRQITYSVNNQNEIQRSISVDGANQGTHTIATGIERLRFHFSPDMQEWYPNSTEPNIDKENVRYIKVSLILVSERDGLGYSGQPFEIVDENFTTTDNRQREFYQKTIPVPNNGPFAAP
ncbi:prepilin-type N-terminal cleavage/methylation domain-containing protein [Chitinispirillales bacterium ANBcel5]|uniref:PilW family protein n=1 Tax=Cellulosispirillum alkaliphilum TaxID=3039283 RepID=UPI002A551404|nr:prepilin-type N-terminal cleavage/methylation domain-containing protein [Chitinispirillales bacterium ANBcel5]